MRDKVELERQVKKRKRDLRWDWLRRPRQRWQVHKLSRAVEALRDE